MIGTTYDFVTGSILAVLTTILVFVISTVIPNEPNGKEGLH